MVNWYVQHLQEGGLLPIAQLPEAGLQLCPDNSQLQLHHPLCIRS